MGRSRNRSTLATVAHPNWKYSDTISLLRWRSGHNQVDFGDRFGVSGPTVLRWEAGRLPKQRQIEMICRAFGIDEAQFFGVTSIDPRELPRNPHWPVPRPPSPKRRTVAGVP